MYLAQPLSDQIWVNRAFCGKSTKFGTHVHDTKKCKFSYSAKPDFPCGAVAGIFKNGRYVTISQKLRGLEPSLSNLHIGFLGHRFQKKYCRIHHAIVSAIYAKYKVIRLSQKLRGAEPSISTLCLGFVGRGFQKKYCRIYHAIVSTILEAI